MEYNMCIINGFCSHFVLQINLFVYYKIIFVPATNETALLRKKIALRGNFYCFILYCTVASRKSLLCVVL